MAISLKSVVTAAVLTVVVVGLGSYGLSGRVVGQESKPEATVKVVAPADPFDPEPVKVVKPNAATDEVTPLPASSISVATGSPRLHAYEMISRALDQEAMLEFSDAPLSEIVDYLKTAHNIPIMIDRKGLDDIGLQSDTPITISVTGIALRSGLARMLGQFGLDYYIKHEVLVITSQEEARANLDPRIYRTNNLQIPEEKLIEIITTMVAPDTWEEAGGTGKITSLGGALKGLVIAQTVQIHDEIADLLEKLEQANTP